MNQWKVLMNALKLPAFVVLTLTVILTGCGQEKYSGVEKEKITVACYYFPNYHIDARNEKVHGPGWTEWELVKNARPRFDGHDQPKVPLWGYTNEADPHDMAQKIDAAADHGVDVFIFDWYYYDDGPFLQRALENGFLRAFNRNRLKFALMWANHDWKDIHPKSLHKKGRVLYPGVISRRTFEEMTDYIIEHYFRKPNYWKINGCPYFFLYEIQTLTTSFGDLETTAKALQRFRDKTKAAGFPDLHLNAVVWGNPILPGETRVKNIPELIDYLGFDSVTSYVWIHHVRLPEFPQTPYSYVQQKYFEYARKAVRQFNVPYYPNVTMGWDSSPRCNQADPFVAEGYPFMATIGGNTPKAFKEALNEMKTFLLQQLPEDRIVTINAWNEWTEGSYLEPDVEHGFKYLEAIRDVFGSKF